MARFRDIDVHMLEDMDPDEQFDFLEGITDEQAENSDVDGDSDADDYHESQLAPVSVRPGSSRKRSRSPGVNEDFPEDFHIEVDEVNEEHPLSRSSERSDDDDLPLQNLIDLGHCQALSKHAHIKWSKQNAENTYASSLFTENIGPKIPVNIHSPLEIFLSLFHENILENIVTESNRYANQKNTPLDLSVDELKAFLGMLIIMGFNKLPSLRLYWSTDVNFHSQRIAEITSLKRFLKVLRFLHINDNERMPQRGDDEYDKLYKVRPLITAVQMSFHEAYSPGRNMAVDESMVAFKGRTTLKQYMPLKPIKREIKLWAIACAETGFLANFQVYEGKKKNETAEKDLLGLGERVVLQLGNSLLDTNRCLYFDNFFTSINLLTKLLERKTFACGTFRSNRVNYPRMELLPDKQLKASEFDSVQAKGITVSKWRDRGTKCVVVASSIHTVSEISTVQRRDKTGIKVTVSCPKGIEDYNKNMGGVDLFDQLHACYNIAWKSRRWWLKIFYYLVDACIVNAYLLYKIELTRNHVGKKPMSQLKFRSILANQLIGEFSNRGNRGSGITIGRNKMNKFDGRAVSVENTVRLSNVGVHMPVHTTSRRCARCSTDKHVKRSSIMCSKCNVALCLPCFPLFHNKNY